MAHRLRMHEAATRDDLPPASPGVQNSVLGKRLRDAFAAHRVRHESVVDGYQRGAKLRIGHFGFTAVENSRIAPAVGTVFLANLDRPAHAILLNIVSLDQRAKFTT